MSVLALQLRITLADPIYDQALVIINTPILSVHVAERHRLVAQRRQLFRRELVMSSFSDDLSPLLVDTGISEKHYTGRDQPSTRETQFQGMPKDIAGPVLLSVEVGGERSA